MTTFRVLGYALDGAGKPRHLTQSELLVSGQGPVIQTFSSPVSFSTSGYTVSDEGAFSFAAGNGNTPPHVEFWQAAGIANRISGAIGGVTTSEISDASVAVAESWNRFISTNQVSQRRGADPAEAVFSGADTILGNQQADVLFGYGGGDLIEGLAGDDVLSGGTGNDSIAGGSGNDAIDGGWGPIP